MYTDGSKIRNAHCVGCAIYCPELNIEKKTSINKAAFVYTAECIALLNAFEFALNYSHRDIFIFSDSLSALQALKSIKIDIKTNWFIFKIKEIFNAFNKKSKNLKNIKLFWIPSHTEIEGNEQVDALAKIATDSELPEITKIPFTDFSEVFKFDAAKNTKNRIEQQGKVKGRVYFDIYYDNCKKPWYAGKNLSRDLIVNRCRADHYNLAYSVARVGIVNNAMCDCESSEENLNHVFWQCEKYDKQRQKLVKSLLKLGHSPPFNIESFLANLNIFLLQTIFTYVKECSLKL